MDLDFQRRDRMVLPPNTLAPNTKEEKSMDGHSGVTRTRFNEHLTAEFVFPTGE